MPFSTRRVYLGLRYSRSTSCARSRASTYSLATALCVKSIGDGKNRTDEQEKFVWEVDELHCSEGKASGDEEFGTANLYGGVFCVYRREQLLLCLDRMSIEEHLFVGSLPKEHPKPKPSVTGNRYDTGLPNHRNRPQYQRKGDKLWSDITLPANFRL